MAASSTRAAIRFRSRTVYRANQTFQTGGDGFSRYETTNPRTPVERASIFTHLNFDVADATNLFFETSFGMVDAHNLGRRTLVQRRTGDHDPADEPVHSGADSQPHGWRAPAPPTTITSFRLGKHWDDWGRVESHSDNEVSRLVVGAEGELNDNWTWDTYYQLAYNDRHQYLLRQPINNNFTRALNAVTIPRLGSRSARSAEHEPDGRAPPRVAGPSIRSGPTAGIPAARDYVLGTLHEWYKMNEYVVAGNVQGEIFELPGGPIGFAAGIETRRDNGAVTHDECSRSSCYWQNFGDDFAGKPQGHRRLRRNGDAVHEGQARRRAARARRGAAADALREQPAGALRVLQQRHDHLRRRPLEHDRRDDLQVQRCCTIRRSGSASARRGRATFARRTSRSCTSEPRAWGSRAASNPWTGATDLPLVANTGNVDVTPKRATRKRSASCSRRTGRGARASGCRSTGGTSRFDGAIARARHDRTIVDSCFLGNDALCTFIDGDGPGGVITNIRNPYLNLDVYSTKGVDLEASVSVRPVGWRAIGLPLVRDAHRRGHDGPRGSGTDYAGVTGPDAFGQPEWALNGTVSYDRTLGVSMQARYIDSGIYNATWIDPERAGLQPDDPNTDRPLIVNDNTSTAATYSTFRDGTDCRCAASAPGSCSRRSTTCSTRIRRSRRMAAIRRTPRSSIRSAGRSALVSAATSGVPATNGASRTADAPLARCGGDSRRGSRHPHCACASRRPASFEIGDRFCNDVVEARVAVHVGGPVAFDGFLESRPGAVEEPGAIDIRLVVDAA